MVSGNIYLPAVVRRSRVYLAEDAALFVRHPGRREAGRGSWRVEQPFFSTVQLGHLMMTIVAYLLRQACAKRLPPASLCHEETQLVHRSDHSCCVRVSPEDKTVVKNLTRFTPYVS